MSLSAPEYNVHTLHAIKLHFFAVEHNDQTKADVMQNLAAEAVRNTAHDEVAVAFGAKH
jgi:hypothetical protein